ncbi:MAG TPA: hypothetical protein VGE01_06545, partial [Fimbriimonas sp.]
MGVLRGRPLIYVYSCELLAPHFGSDKAVGKAFRTLRQAFRKAEAGDPYLVAQVWDAGTGVRCIDDYGFDAMSGYSLPGGGAHEELPFSDLTKANLGYWNGFAATGKPVVPLLNIGWDGRPRLVDPSLAPFYSGPWYRQPARGEIANSVRQTISWIRGRPRSTPANTVLLYAWNETDEGGWLVPTLKEGDRRLEELRSVLATKRR